MNVPLHNGAPAPGAGLLSAGDTERLPVPLVSVIVANWNGERFLAGTLHAILSQSVTAIEVIVADDASTDGSCALVEAIAATDPRVRLLRAPANGGPAAARNRALDAARGRWAAVVDSDDLLHPERLRRLVAAAEAAGSDIAADDLLIFDDGGVVPPSRMLPPGSRQTFTVDAAGWIRANTLFAGGPMLGYLKPIFRREALQRHGVRYDERLRIAEDYDFILQLLLAGARFSVHPDLTYFYRKHAASISHRLSLRTLSAMAAANDVPLAEGAPEVVRAALRRRAGSLSDALAFEHLVAALKARRPLEAMRQLLHRPGAARPLAGAMGDRLRRLSRRRGGPQAATGEGQVALITRQPLEGWETESGRRLLRLVSALAGAGLAVDLLCPAPGAPATPQAPPPGVRRLLLRGNGMRDAGAATDAVPADDAAALFVAQHAHGAAIVLADGEEMAALLPYSLRPEKGWAVLRGAGLPGAALPDWAGMVFDLQDGSAAGSLVDWAVRHGR
ncbi:glycosyltransferase [Roseomonas sp. OT10]|uniref:glycosyltransferase family 2 protein n=1 Tax=Roseomonas cutis TaxID=2897332 RepID=UPI001E4F61C7|nr:glycosyltransferase [Roseomonas sp. OT10]UFN50471.1 glycosyltransferase [Roseomonas sp. OT10]